VGWTSCILTCDPDSKPAEYSSVPRLRVENFVGREEQLEQIGAVFSTRCVEEPRIVVLHAMREQGKSQIALKYCEELSEVYRGLFWINASSEATTKQAYVSVVETLDKAARPLLDDGEKVKFVLRTPEGWRLLSKVARAQFIMGRVKKQSRSINTPCS
jgi:hypothetical protein